MSSQPPVRGRSGALSDASDPEAGFTLLEVMISTVVAAILAVSVSGIMLSMQQTSSRAIGGENASGAARAGLLQLQRDVEAANPLVGWTSNVSSYENEIQLKLGPAGGTQQTITWSYVSDAPGPSCTGTLYRDIGTTAGVGVPEVTGVTNCRTGTSVFSFFGQQGENILANLATATAANVTECSVRVEGTLDVSAGANTVPFTETVSMRLVNWQPGTQPCP